MNEHEAHRGGGHRTVRLDLSYRGTGFRGFAANAGVRTVGGDLSAALERILGEAPALTVAGRTDAGVHATGQVVSFRVGPVELRRIGPNRNDGNQPGGLPDWAGGADRASQSDRGDRANRAERTNRRDHLDGLDRLAASLNRLLQPEIAVTAASLADDGFDARHSAVARAYEYRVRNTVHPDPRYGDLEWHVGVPLDIDRMNDAAGRFVGEHDFTSFCRRPKDRPDASLVRTVSAARWSAEDSRVLFEIEANAFCHQMVRAVVGHCVAVGRGDRAADDVPAVLAARRRDAAAPIAPPHGLTLIAVRYPE